jgi:hypothetical protein
MEQFRKVSAWLWRNKEKLVLAALVIVLIYQVYQVQFAAPEEDPEKIVPVPPRGGVPARMQDLPPELPLMPARPDENKLVASNPFSAEGLGAGEVDEFGDRQPDLELIEIRPWTGGTYVAEIRTQTARPKRYGVGDQFESYQIISIDPSAGEVVIYSEEHRRNFTYTLE